MAENPKQSLVPKIDEKPMEFIPFGGNDKIKLTVEIVRNLIAVPSKSGKLPSTKDCMKFMMLAQAKKLNPFEGDAFLLGYDTKDGGAQFSLITAHQAYLKRAELHPEFDGMKSGIIVADENGVVTDLEGDFYLDSQTVIGGWATVMHKTRKVPTHRRLRLKRFQKPWGIWQDDPAGMICKCAEADALRSSFPTLLGGLYLREEIELPMTSVVAHEINPSRLVDIKSADPEPSGEAPAGDTTVAGTDAPQDQSKLAKQDNDLLGELIIAEGFTFDHFRKWCQETGNVWDGFDSCASFAEVPVKTATRLLRAKTGLLNGLKQIKETKNV